MKPIFARYSPDGIHALRFWGADLAGDIENAALRLPGRRQLHAHKAIDGEVCWLLAEQDSLGDVRREKGQGEKLSYVSFRLS